MLSHGTSCFRLGGGSGDDRLSDTFQEVYLLARRMLGQLQKLRQEAVKGPKIAQDNFGSGLTTFHLSTVAVFYQTSSLYLQDLRYR